MDKAEAYLRRTVKEYKQTFPGLTDIHLNLILAAEALGGISVEHASVTLSKFPGIKPGSNDAYNRDMMHVNISALEGGGYKPRISALCV